LTLKGVKGEIRGSLIILGFIKTILVAIQLHWVMGTGLGSTFIGNWLKGFN